MSTGVSTLDRIRRNLNMFGGCFSALQVFWLCCLCWFVFVWVFYIYIIFRITSENIELV